MERGQYPHPRGNAYRLENIGEAKPISGWVNDRQTYISRRTDRKLIRDIRPCRLIEGHLSYKTALAVNFRLAEALQKPAPPR